MTVQGNGNPSPFKGKTPPAHVPAVPVPHLSVQRLNVVRWSEWGITNRGKFVYDKGPERSMMFNLKPGDLSNPIHADCSQFFASICHWSGIPGFTDTDYTGTLLSKGLWLQDTSKWQPGDGVTFGPGNGDHQCVLESHDGMDWWVVGFGHQGAPDRGTLSGTAAWFNQNGMPGVRVHSYTK